MSIHALSCVHPDAKIGNNVNISPFCFVEADVEIGDNTWIAPNANIMNGTRIGKNCKIFQGAVLGTIPQDLKYKGEKTYLYIGDNTVVREYCTINIGTGATGKTAIGKNCLVMAYAHVAHDCIIGDNVVLANNVTLAGHIEVGNFARLGGMVAVHQFVKIGEDVFVGGGSLVPCDIPPFILAARTPLAYAGINRVGLQRRGYSTEQIDNIRDVYRILFVDTNNLSQAVNTVENEVRDTPEKKRILTFIQHSTRGLIKSYRTVNNNSSGKA